MKKFHVITIFPEIIDDYIRHSIVKRAIANGIISVETHNPRDYTTDKHRSVDDYPYGGGAGMVMKPEPFFSMVDELWPAKEDRTIIMLSPQGSVFDQDRARRMSEEERDTILLCGRYEAVDQRVIDRLVDEEISIGDYVLTGGELPALVIIDAVSRLLPGVLGDSRSPVEESFSYLMLDHPHYTRPETYREVTVPEVLRSGNHAEILRWRRKEALRSTLKKRPDLLRKCELSLEDKKLLDEILEEMR